MTKENLRKVIKIISLNEFFLYQIIYFMKNVIKIKIKMLILISAFMSIFTKLAHTEDSPQNFPAVFELASLNGTNGFIIDGLYQKDESGWSVSKAGDTNGDGINDMLIGALGANGQKGQAYVVFGSNKKNWTERVYLANLNGTDGFIINGIHDDRHMYFYLCNAGDINGDSIDDFLIGVSLSEKNYVIFGSKQPWPRTLDLTNFSNINGFIINILVQGKENDNYIDSSISGVGDVNGDNIDDILIGNGFANNSTGQSYVIFGSKEEWPKIFNVTNLNGTNGFTIEGINQSDFSGQCVSGIGDVNGDQIKDLFVFAPEANSSQGQGYVVFGSKNIWPANMRLSSLNGTNGFRITGKFFASDSYTGPLSASPAGDVNGDGIQDILIGAPAANNYVGICYVIFGTKGNWPSIFDLNKLDGNNGFAINGKNDGPGWVGISVIGIGDVNNDGIDDVLIGGVNDSRFHPKGESYVIFGRKNQWPAAIYVQDLDGNNGFTINNIANVVDDYNYVGGPGDINGDGINDLLIGDMRVNGQTGQSYVIFGCCTNVTPPRPPDDNIPFILEMVFGIGGGVLVLTGIGNYYGYQYWRQGDYLGIQ